MKKFIIEKPTMGSMTDEELYKLCRKFGSAALEARRKFAGLLPEVFKRKLYARKRFSSIFEFAAKLAGMSKEQVSLILNLEKKFEDKPVLHEALVSGEVSVNKLVRVASIANVENQGELFEKMKNLSNRAVEVFVKDVKNSMVETEKSGSGVDVKNQNGYLKPLFDLKSLHVQTFNTDLKLDEDVKRELLEMQEKGIDVNEFLRSVLKERREKIEEKKDEIARRKGVVKKVGKETGKEIVSNQKSIADAQKFNSSRYIPVAVRKIIKEEHGTKCSYPGCSKQAQILHHTRRFALVHDHNPCFIAPLCAAHHEIAHKIDVKFVKNSVS
jgi:hypothetical protein